MSELEALEKRIKKLENERIVHTNFHSTQTDKLIVLDTVVGRLWKWHEPEGIAVSPKIVRPKVQR